MSDSKHDSYVTVTRGDSGWFAVCIWWNPDGFWEPYQTGIGRYSTRREAETEAKSWAEADKLKFRQPL